MINRFLRRNKYMAAVLLVLRFYLGYTWMVAGWHKIVDGFNAGGFLNNAVANPVIDKGTGALVYPNFVAFLENFALGNVKLINVLIPWGEFLVGVGLILGCLTTAAVFFGIMMNFMFLFAGTVSTNPWMLLIGFVIIAAGANAGKLGADYYVLPYLRKLLRIKPNAPAPAAAEAV